MIDRLDARLQRRLAAGLLVAAVVAVLGVTVLPVWSANASRQATLDELQERLQRYEHVAARDQSLLPEYEALRERQMAAGNYLKSGTVAVAGAELQRRMTDIAAANQVQILSTQILPPAGETGFVRIAIKVRLRGPLPALLQSLYDIETDEVFMFLDHISMTDRMAGRSTNQTGMRPMDAEFELAAYMPDVS